MRYGQQNILLRLSMGFFPDQASAQGNYTERTDVKYHSWSLSSGSFWGVLKHKRDYDYSGPRPELTTVTVSHGSHLHREGEIPACIVVADEHRRPTCCSHSAARWPASRLVTESMCHTAVDK